jgi:hypothetical protein
VAVPRGLEPPTFGLGNSRSRLNFERRCACGALPHFVVGRLPRRMRDTFLLEAAAAIDGKPLGAGEVHRIAIETARRVIQEDFAARGRAAE